MNTVQRSDWCLLHWGVLCLPRSAQTSWTALWNEGRKCCVVLKVVYFGKRVITQSAA